MSDWLHSLPVVWMALLVFGLTYSIAAAIYAIVTVLAVGERARSFKAVSPGLLPVLGIIFGLFVAFTAAQVWTDNEKARAEIDREASALRTVVILATSVPRELDTQLRELIRRYIADAATQEWPMMAQRKATLRAIVNLLKWSCLFMQAVCALAAIAMVHCDNRLASIIAMGIFATGVAASMLLILAHDRPFTHEFSLGPDPLLQVMPEIGS